MVGEPELAISAGPSDRQTLRSLSTLQAHPDGSENETLAALFEATPLEARPESPLGDLDLAPTGGRELTRTDDGPGSVDLSSTLNAIHAFLGGMNLTGAADRFSFGSLAGGQELAPADNSPLDPYLDAMDPAWVGDLMATLLPDGTINFDQPSDLAGDPMVNAPVDGLDGWVV